MSACWDQCTEGQISTVDRVQKIVALFTVHKKDSDWETLAQRRIARLCALYKAYSGERARKAILIMLRRPYSFSRIDLFEILGTRSKERILGSIPL